MENRYLTTEDICKKFGIVRRTVDRWRKEGMPHIKINRTIRFDEQEVQEWVNKHKK